MTMKRNASWKFTYNKFDPPTEALREALCTLGNGYFATRGAFCGVTASKIHYPGTYMHGVYNRLPTHIAGRTIVNEDLVNCPNWLFLAIKVGQGEWFSLAKSRIISYRQELDMHRGVLSWKIRFRNQQKQQTFLKIDRIVSMADEHIGAMRYEITPENYSDTITVRHMLDGRVQNTGVERYRQLNSKHWQFSSSGAFASNGVVLLMRTNHSKIDLVQASRVRIFTQDNKEIRPGIKKLVKNKERIGQEFSIFAAQRNSYAIEKTVAIYTSRDHHLRRLKNAAQKTVRKAPRFEALLESHEKVWEQLWQKADVVINGDAFAQKAIRFHIFHLLQTASPHTASLDAALPARGLHGEAYRGHIFWDTLFTMPFFDFHFPTISQGFLKYRYRRLKQARKYASQYGYRGAMFPWQSGSSGREETQVVHLNPLSGEWGPDHSSLQRHVSFAIAYNVYHYWERTHDIEFMEQYGAEILLSIAQFGASMTRYDSADKRYHIRRVMGPDEFHEKYPHSKKGGLRDNTYTNIMVVWTLKKAREMIDVLNPRIRKKILRKLKITPQELAAWEKITRKMKVVANRKHIISQFEGYFSLKELDWKGYRAEYGDIHRMDRILKAEGKSPDAYKVSKQADVLMIFYLLPFGELRQVFKQLGYRFQKGALRRNYDYYEKRTSHGSTLSKVTHCFIAYLLGRKKEGYQKFVDVLNSDLNDVQGGTTPEGIHCGVMGGSLDMIMRGFAGIWSLHGKLTVDPLLPAHWKKLSFSFCYRRRWLSLEVTQCTVMIHIDPARSIREALAIEVKGREQRLEAGKKYTFTFKQKR